MPQKASTPWSARTVAEGGTDSPVGDLVPVPDEITPVVNTGFISTTGKYNGVYANDREFTFQDPFQALAAGADIEIDIDMTNHDILILGIVDTSGNEINIDIEWKMPTTLTGAYSPFAELGGAGSRFWPSNVNQTASELVAILNDTSSTLTANWVFNKIIYLRGCLGRIIIHNNEGADAGTISTAYQRLV